MVTQYVEAEPGSWEISPIGRNIKRRPIPRGGFLALLIPPKNHFYKEMGERQTEAKVK